jgi:hypothetical protein
MIGSKIPSAQISRKCGSADALNALQRSAPSCVAKALGVPIDTDPRALAILHEWVKTTGAEMNEARMRMTRIPQDAVHPQQGVGGTWLLDR